MTGWRDRANCHGDWDLFFAPEAERPQDRAARLDLAAAVCEECPVLAECGEYAERRGISFGFWAGVDREAVREERRKRKGQAA